MDLALEILSNRRANIGALSNRPDHIIANNTNIAKNIAKSISRREDADFAAQTTNLAKTQILQQASTAMLAQAYAAKQNVLSLLQGKNPSPTPFPTESLFKLYRHVKNN